jgi:ribosomal protein L24
MSTQNLAVSVGDHVFLVEGGEEVGAVRKVAKDHLTVYIEGAGDFTIRGNQVHSAHDGKLVLLQGELEPDVLAAARHAHDSETE